MTQDNDTITFNIKCTMKFRWARQFIAALKTMQNLGNAGSSRIVAIYSDGDGDFRPKFDIDSIQDNDTAAIHKKLSKISDEMYFFDAG